MPTWNVGAVSLVSDTTSPTYPMAVSEEPTSTSSCHDASLDSNTMAHANRPHRAARNAVVGPADTVDTDTVLHPLPAVTHEVVQPEEHHVTHQHIIREIHNHDVFHRILPVTDVEILPTKHYFVDPARPGTLQEMPAADAPASSNNWPLSAGTTTPPLAPGGPAPAANQDASTSDGLATARRCCHETHNDGRAEPVLTDKISYLTEEGVPRTVYFWRHPPTLDTSTSYQQASVPFRMDCVPPGEFAAHLAARAQQPPSEGRHRTDAAPSLVPLAERPRPANAALARDVHNRVGPRDIATATHGRSTSTDHTTTIQHRWHPSAEESMTRPPSADAKPAGAEEALAAANAATAVAQEGVAAHATRRPHVRHHPAVDVERAAKHPARAPWAGAMETRAAHVPHSVAFEASEDEESWSDDTSGDEGVRERMRARLQKAKNSIVEVLTS